jgi:hypothetical protein
MTTLSAAGFCAVGALAALVLFVGLRRRSLFPFMLACIVLFVPLSGCGTGRVIVPAAPAVLAVRTTTNINGVATVASIQLFVNPSR